MPHPVGDGARPPSPSADSPARPQPSPVPRPCRTRLNNSPQYGAIAPYGAVPCRYPRHPPREHFEHAEASRGRDRGSLWRLERPDRLRAAQRSKSPLRCAPANSVLAQMPVPARSSSTNALRHRFSPCRRELAARFNLGRIRCRYDPVLEHVARRWSSARPCRRRFRNGRTGAQWFASLRIERWRRARPSSGTELQLQRTGVQRVAPRSPDWRHKARRATLLNACGTSRPPGRSIASPIRSRAARARRAAACGPCCMRRCRGCAARCPCRRRPVRVSIAAAPGLALLCGNGVRSRPRVRAGATAPYTLRRAVTSARGLRSYYSAPFEPLPRSRATTWAGDFVVGLYVWALFGMNWPRRAVRNRAAAR